MTELNYSAKFRLGRQILLLASASALLAGCGTIGGLFGGGEKKTTPTVGNRQDIFGAAGVTVADPKLADVSVVLLAPSVNENWAQPGGNAAKAPGHVALGDNLTLAWSAQVKGASPQARLAAAPVISGGRLIVVDTDAVVSAFDAGTGAKIWTKALDTDGKSRSSLFGGGASVSGDFVYATNGVGDVAALQADTGTEVWKKRPGGPLRGSPTISSGNVYVMTQDNRIFALRATDGEGQWNEAGPVAASGIFGVAAPAAAAGTVIAGYSSGELSAYRYENGQNLWTDTLSRTTMSTSVSTLTDIDADPVIDRGRVFALGKGGRMASYELASGSRIWEINIAGISTPVISGEWVFVLTDDAKLLCVQRATGKVRWVSQLPQYRNQEKKSGVIAWHGPVLAGGRLIVANTEGQVWAVSPGEGSSSMLLDLHQRISLDPVVANNTLYIFDDSGRISAFR